MDWNLLEHVHMIQTALQSGARGVNNTRSALLLRSIGRSRLVEDTGTLAAEQLLNNS